MSRRVAAKPAREAFNYGYKYRRHRPYSAVDYNGVPDWKMEWYCNPPPLGMCFALNLSDFTPITRNTTYIGCRIYRWRMATGSEPSWFTFVRRQNGDETWMESQQFPVT